MITTVRVTGRNIAKLVANSLIERFVKFECEIWHMDDNKYIFTFKVYSDVMEELVDQLDIHHAVQFIA